MSRSSSLRYTRIQSTATRIGDCSVTLGLASAPLSSCPTGQDPNTCFFNQDLNGNPIYTGPGWSTSSVLGFSNLGLSAVCSGTAPGETLPPPFDPCPDDPECSKGIQPTCCRTNQDNAPGANNTNINSTCSAPNSICYPCGQGLTPITGANVLQNGLETTSYICALLPTTKPITFDMSAIVSKYPIEGAEITWFSSDGNCNRYNWSNGGANVWQATINPGASMCIYGNFNCGCYSDNYTTPNFTLNYATIPAAGVTIKLTGIPSCGVFSGCTKGSVAISCTNNDGSGTCGVPLKGSCNSGTYKTSCNL